MNKLIAPLCAFACILPCFSGFSQITSISDGNWNSSEIWDCACIPDFSGGTITINDNVTISTLVEADEITVAGGNSLTIANGGRLILKEGNGDDLILGATPSPGQVIVNAGGVLENRGQISSIASAMIFNGDSEYQHNQNAGVIANATWQSGSICRVTGWTNTITPDAVFLASLSQSFHHFIWDSPSQTAANVFLAGNLRTVAGDLIINNTNSGPLSNRRITLGFNGPASGGISIGGRLVVTGNSKITFSSSGTYTMTVGRNVEFSSTSSDGTGNQYLLTSTGTTNLNIEGDLIVNSGQFNLSAGISSGVGSVTIEGSFELNGGSIHKTGGGTGNLTFSGGNSHALIVGSGTFTANQSINYIVGSGDILDLGTFALGSGLGGSGTFTNNGTVIFGSAEPTGALSGNLLTDPNIFAPGSTIIYRGALPQFVGSNHPTGIGVNTVIDNADGVSLLGETVIGGDLTVKSGSAFHLAADISVGGNINFEAGSVIEPSQNTLTMTGGNARTFFGGNATMNNLEINTTGGADVILTGSLSLTGQLSVVSSNSSLISNGFLRLISTSDSTLGNATITPLRNGASIVGDVTVERFMSNEGRIYRYISSPITNASIAQLQDDFPVTGSFPESSTCPGCSSNPSLFYYDAAVSEYVEYPDNSNNEQLAMGRGYAAFVRQNELTSAVTLDLTGPINQGNIFLPVFYDNNPAESWNLVGNPYPSSIDWDAAGWTKTNIGSMIAIQDNGPAQGFRYWNGSVGSGAGGGLIDGEIAAGQGFWVRALSASPTPVLSISEEAKINSTAGFYRDREVNALAITVSKGELNDMVVLQLHENAARGLDTYDAPKMVNPKFDFSIQVDSTLFAINATNEINCDENLLLNLRFSKNSSGANVINPKGRYLMQFKFLGLEFFLFDITLVDNYLNSNAVITPAYSHSFEITNDPASMASNRFYLRFSATPPSPMLLENIDVPMVCNDSSIVLLVRKSEPGLEYGLTKDGSLVSNSQSGNGGDITFAVSGTLMSLGTNLFEIYSRNVCSQVSRASIEILKEQVTVPQVASEKRCGEGQVELSVEDANPTSTYFWYEDLDDERPVFIGDRFTTSHLFKSKTYFVSAVHAAGCESDRKAVKAQIVQYEQAKISLVGSDSLRSNSEIGNQWFFEGQTVDGANNQFLKISYAGTYALEVTRDGCKSYDQMEYNITSIEDDVIDSFEAFPNPTTRDVFVQLPILPENIKTISVMNSLGHQVGSVSIFGSRNGPIGHADLHQLPNGIYYVRIIATQKIITIKFVKN